MFIGTKLPPQWLIFKPKAEEVSLFSDARSLTLTPATSLSDHVFYLRNSCDF